MKRRALWTLGVIAWLAVAGYLAVLSSPWPSALFYGFFMDRGGAAQNQALERHVPAGVAALRNQQYDAKDPDALLDVYTPPQPGGALPAIVWMHGGGFFSGDRSHVANYLKILAAKGYTTVAVGYSLGPSKHYPTPVRQANAALAYLAQNAASLRVDPQRLFLAGDSAGAQIAAQLATVLSVPAYAAEMGIAPSVARAQLRGVILHCGVYDVTLTSNQGMFGHFMETAVWSYSGRRSDEGVARLKGFSVTRRVTADFPPAFISAGNGDPLLPHSRALAEALVGRGVKVDALFFPAHHKPSLPHEYQFNLDTEAGREALARTVEFMAQHQ